MTHINFAAANCRNCYKCLRSCPVKAVKFRDQQAEIMEERCIKCGHCLYHCPQNASYIQSDLYKVKEAVKHGKNVIASIDPSYPAYFNEAAEEQIIAAIKELGFKDVEESSKAIEAMDSIYKDYIIKSSGNVLISTSCPSTNYLVEKYYPELIKYLIPLDSPMVAHGKILKQNFGTDSFVVHLAPCVSRKFEAAEFENHNIIDAVLTFDELHRWLLGSTIDINLSKASSVYNEPSKPRMGFHVGEGISKGLRQVVNEKNMEFISVNSINHCMEIFKELSDGKLGNVFVDVSACRGNCIGGPNVMRNSQDFFSKRRKVKEYLESRTLKNEPAENRYSIDFYRNFSDKSVFKDVIHEQDIQRVMRLMGKHDIRDELNCGVCGYNTCRDKAQAVCLGMAEIDMCLNFMRGKAESITNVIFKNSPNIIMIVDDDANIVEINPAAEEIFLTNAENIKGKPVSTLINSGEILKVKESRINILGRRVEYPEYNGIFIQNIVYLEKHSIILITMNNIIESEKSKAELMNVRENTLNAAQEIIEKQMRVAHEIASLLGETTAETKITITNLKKLVQGN